MSAWTTAVLTLILGCVVSVYIRPRILRKHASHSLPPGPPGIPWIGNVIGINKDAPWKTYAEWAKTYGDIVYSRLMGKDVIIINSERIAKDLLENRSSNYSDRPFFITNELCGLYFNTVLAPYGNRWRLHRRFFHQTFRFNVIPRLLPLQHRKMCRLLQRLIHSPEELDDHVLEYTGSLILNCAYDYDPVSRHDELLDIAEKTLKIVVPAVRPDIALIVGAFPSLLYLPSWFPGMSFKRDMEIANAYSKQYLERLFAYSLQRVRSNGSGMSMVHDALRNLEEKGISPEQSWTEALKEASGSALLAGFDTSHSVLMTFFLVMMLNPTVQEKAQTQIDAVVGSTRLPTMADRSSLPLLDAILWETLRYNPVAPLAAPHVAMNNDIYNGFHIPKGAIVLPNLWSMAHDESRFPNPDAFIPERFLDESGSLKPKEIEHIAFGFGRRICVGQYFADTLLWIAIVNVLAVFKILKPLDENGEEMSPEPNFSNGVLVHPLPFKCRIVPRCPDMNSGKLEEMIGVGKA